MPHVSRVGRYIVGRSIALEICCLAALLSACDLAPLPRTLAPAQPVIPSMSFVPPRSFDSAEVAEWIRFRQAYGLRADRAWVLEVARNPAAVSELPVPLLPGEIDIVAQLDLKISELIPALQAYGVNFPNEYAGAFIDGTAAVLQFTEYRAEHQASVDALFGDSVRIEVRDVAYSLGKLATLASQVDVDRDWFPTVGAELYETDVSVQSNSVRVRYQAKDESSEPAIREHFGQPNWMSLRWYGPLAWTGPLGDLRVIVVDRSGRPVVATCTPDSVELGVSANFLPHGSGADGICEFKGLPATTYEVRVMFQNRRDERIDLKTLTSIPANGTRTVRFVVDD